MCDYLCVTSGLNDYLLSLIGVIVAVNIIAPVTLLVFL
jgi:hypothetical protein